MATEKAEGTADWNRYIESLARAKVPEKSRRWYVLRVEQYLKAHPGLSLPDHTAAVMSAYLSRVGRHWSLEGWQFYQLTHALQIFFQDISEIGWAADFDWRYWLDSSKTLETSHPTVARHNTPVRPATPDPCEVDPIDAGSARWIEGLVAEIRRRNYSIRTEEAYAAWLRRYIGFHNNADPSRMGAQHVAAYLSHLALSREVSPNTQNQALNALVFFYGQVLQTELGTLPGWVAAKTSRRLPVVLTRAEVRQLLTQVTDEPFALIAGLLYGTGMRLMECVRLRVKDIDFGYSQIVVRNGKGDKDRWCRYPVGIVRPSRLRFIRSSPCIVMTLHTATARSSCQQHLPGSIPMRRGNRGGSIYSRRERCPSIRGRPK